MKVVGLWKAAIGFPTFVGVIAIPFLYLEGRLTLPWLVVCLGMGVVLAALAATAASRGARWFVEGAGRAATVEVTEDSFTWLAGREMVLRTEGIEWKVEVDGGRFVKVRVEPPVGHPGDELVAVPRGDLREHAETITRAIVAGQPVTLSPGPMFSNAPFQRWAAEPLRWGAVLTLGGTSTILIVVAVLGWAALMPLDPAFVQVTGVIGLVSGGMAVVVARWPGSKRA